MKLNVGRTLLLGFGFFGISIITGINKSYVAPFLGTDFGLKANEVSLIVTLGTIITFLIQPMIGSVSDNTRTRFGRRIPFIIIFAPLAALGFALLPVLVQPGMLWVFVAVLLLTTVALALFRTPVIALMPDITPSQFRSQANGLINLMGGIGGILAFAAGAYLYGLNRALPFSAAAAALVLACAIVVWKIKEPQDGDTKAVEARPGLIQSLRVVLAEREKSALLLFCAIFSWFVGYNAVETFFTLYGVKMLKLQPNNAAFLLSFLALMFVLFAVPSGYIAGRVGRRKTILTGIATLAILLAVVRALPVDVQTSGAVLPILLALAGVAWALINVNSLAMVVDVAPQTELGTYTGLYYFFSTAAAVIGPILAGYLIEAMGGDYGMIFVLAPITLVFAFVFMLAVRRGERAE
ncbi:MAG: SLC45 family MFS transporter [Chloroflexi bacterium]|nr:SLC45 family MFS transporter [Chloroflexota bacterium]